MNDEIKIKHLSRLSEYRNRIIKYPLLKNLFLELTLKCNQHCIHCGSSCGDVEASELSAELCKKILDEVKQDFDIQYMMLNITGGEPLMHENFFEIMDYANKLGFIWGMTSNATLIDETVAESLRKCGMRTVSVSIDGLKDTHDRLRDRRGAFDSAMRGVQALVDNGGFEHVQVTTVINHENIDELQALFEVFDKIDIDSWRIANIEPIGRARHNLELMLTKEEYKHLMNFIADKRRKGYPVTYGCCHYLGLDYEREVRDWYFLCNAGLYTASIMSNGDIGACVDIERRPEPIQGNIKSDRLKDVWKNEFKIFRSDLANRNEKCFHCKEKDFCHGGSYHSWDYDNDEPMMCFKNILF